MFNHCASCFKQIAPDRIWVHLRRDTPGGKPDEAFFHLLCYPVAALLTPSSELQVVFDVAKMQPAVLAEWLKLMSAMKPDQGDGPAGTIAQLKR